MSTVASALVVEIRRCGGLLRGIKSQFPPPRLNARCLFSKPTSAGGSGDVQDAPDSGHPTAVIEVATRPVTVTCATPGCLRVWLPISEACLRRIRELGVPAAHEGRTNEVCGISQLRVRLVVTRA